MTHELEPGRLRLLLAAVHRSTGRTDQAVAHAYRALQEAEPLSPVQVQAQLSLSRLAEAMGRQVESLAFALAARVSAAEGGLGGWERRAAARLADQLRRCEWAAVSELAAALADHGIDLYRYLGPGELLPPGRPVGRDEA